MSSITTARQTLATVAAAAINTGVLELKVDDISGDRANLILWCGPERREDDRDERVGVQVFEARDGQFDVSVVDGLRTATGHFETLGAGEVLIEARAARLARLMAQFIAEADRRIARRDKQDDRWAA